MGDISHSKYHVHQLRLWGLQVRAKFTFSFVCVYVCVSV